MKIGQLKEWNTLGSIMSFDLRAEIAGYYDLNDKAHGLDHALDVVRHAEKIIQSFKNELMPVREMILAGAFIHDAFTHLDRETHHLRAATFVRSNFNIGNSYFNVDEVELIAKSVLEHRASWTDKRSSLVSEAVAAADRAPVNMNSYLKRCVMYRFHQLEDKVNISHCNKIAILKECIKHLKEKYGNNGYSYNQMSRYTKGLYSEEIETMKFDLENSYHVIMMVGLNQFDDWTK